MLRGDWLLGEGIIVKVTLLRVFCLNLKQSLSTVTGLKFPGRTRVIHHLPYKDFLNDIIPITVKGIPCNSPYPYMEIVGML